MTILVITEKPITMESCGYSLRVWHLCKALSLQEKLVQLIIQDHRTPINPKLANLDPTTIFSEIETIHPNNELKPFWRATFRWNELQFYPWGYPELHRKSVANIDDLCKTKQISKIIVFGCSSASFTSGFIGEKKLIIDVCDSYTLALKREFKQYGRLSLTQTLKNKLLYLRWKNLESRIPYLYDKVTTINKSDTETIRQLSGAANISTIANGIIPQEDRLATDQNVRRGVAFWGNLSFKPNADAVRFFYFEIYLPFLKDAQVEWCVVGKDAEPWLMEAARQDSQITLTGYVDNLASTLSQYPVMVNPMRIGSGMKNKVLEAFSMGLAVVSTSLGIESFEVSVAGRHHVEANEPGEFAQAILNLLNNRIKRVEIAEQAHELVLKHYTWEAVSKAWVALIDSV